MIKLIDILLEIGDSSAGAYDYRRTLYKNSGEYKYSEYSFKTDSGLNYLVAINKYVHPSWGDYTYSVAFAVREGSKKRLPFKKEKESNEPSPFQRETNRGEQYKVMATVVAIVKDEMAKEKDKVRWVTFSPSKKAVKDPETGEYMEDPNDNRRLNLYMAYVKKQLPNSTVNKKNGTIMVDVGE